MSQTELVLLYLYCFGPCSNRVVARFLDLPSKRCRGILDRLRSGAQATWIGPEQYDVTNVGAAFVRELRRSAETCHSDYRIPSSDRDVIATVLERDDAELLALADWLQEQGHIDQAAQLRHIASRTEFPWPDANLMDAIEHSLGGPYSAERLLQELFDDFGPKPSS